MVETLRKPAPGPGASVGATFARTGPRTVLRAMFGGCIWQLQPLVLPHCSPTWPRGISGGTAPGPSEPHKGPEPGQPRAPPEPAAGETLPAAPQAWPTCGRREVLREVNVSVSPPSPLTVLRCEQEASSACADTSAEEQEKVRCIRSGEVWGVSGEHHAATYLPTTGYRGFSSRHLSSAPSLLQKCQTPLIAMNTTWSAVLALFKAKMNCSVNSKCYL